jgi:SAM-dependent methyltransferase
MLKFKSGYLSWRHRDAPRYTAPGAEDLERIERDLINLGVVIHDYAPSPEHFSVFQNENWFPHDYHGGIDGRVWHEKLLEHWISQDRLGLMNYRPDDIFVDVAAAGSPWVRSLRERKGISAFAIDLGPIAPAHEQLPYYRVEDATNSSFEDASVQGASLHCAYEMFIHDDDTRFIQEIARILKPGGKVVILPLYMHTHYCAYASPEYYGKGYSDPAAKEYIRMDSGGVPSSRKYDAVMLKQRVLDPVEAAGLSYRLLALRNKAELGNGIYCHFILEIER